MEVHDTYMKIKFLIWKNILKFLELFLTPLRFGTILYSSSRLLLSKDWVIIEELCSS